MGSVKIKELREMIEKMKEEGLLSDEALETLKAKQRETGETYWELLTGNGILSRDVLIGYLAKQFQIPVFEKLDVSSLDPKFASVLPEKTAHQFKALIVGEKEEALLVAIEDPFDSDTLDDLERLIHQKVIPVFVPEEELQSALERYYGVQNPLKEMLHDFQEAEEKVEILKDTESSGGTDEEVLIDEAPVIKLVDMVIVQAIKSRASDIHLEPEENKFRIRYRVDGVLREIMCPPKKIQPAVISRVKVMSSMDIAERRNPQDGRFKVKIENRDIDIRVSTIPTLYGEKIVMRLLDRDAVLLKLEDLGFAGSLLEKYKQLILRPYGIFLVTGPTGSGKTTTLYTTLQTINSIEKNIITIEDPVEYNIPGISQISVNVKAGVTFSKGLRSILRQDPDVVMLGEIRDLETAEIAVRAALTGHLVFSTLHTNDAPSTVIRLIDMGIPSYLVASSVVGVLAQRLVRTICGKCKEPYRPTSEEISELRLPGELHTEVLSQDLFRGKGCESCGTTGFRGRTAIFELMPISEELRRLIHSAASSSEIKQAAIRSGMRTLWQEGIGKVIQGMTTVGEVCEAAFYEE